MKTYFRDLLLDLPLRLSPKPTFEVLLGYFIFSGNAGLVAHAGRRKPDSNNRVFPNLWFAKPVVRIRVAFLKFTKTTEIKKTPKTTKTTQTAAWFFKVRFSRSFRERKLNTNFFLSNFSGAAGISRQNPGISRQKGLISLA